MARSITLTLGAGLGADLGPNFNLAANVGTVTPSTATKTELLAGKSVSVDDTATQVTITSTGTCTNAISQTIPCATTSTTSTTSTTTSGGGGGTTTTTTTTAAPGGENFIVSNTTGTGQITDVDDGGGGYFYFLGTGSYPVTNGQQVSGTHGAITGAAVRVFFTNVNIAGCVVLRINTTPIDSLAVPSDGNYTFNNVTFSSGDLVEIIYTNGACP